MVQAAQRIQQYIVVKIVDVGSMALFEQEVALLGKAFVGQVAMQLHVMPMPP